MHTAIAGMVTERTAVGLDYVLSPPSGDPDERGYVLASITRQLLTVPGYRDLSRSDRARLFRLLEERWDDVTAIRLVAHDPADPWLVLGFVLGGPGVLTWLQVRGGFRGLGLAAALAAKLGITRETDAVVELPTWDLIRYEATPVLPLGLLHNPRWHLTLVPLRINP